MKARVLTSLTVAFIIGHIPAAADWQYTKWGMTPEEVIKVSGGAATAPAPGAKPAGALNNPNTELLLKAPYDAGRYKFTAAFFFTKDDHRLAAVQLLLTEKEHLSALSVELAQSLTQKYGKPLNDENTALFHRIDWKTETESIEYMCLGGHDRPIGVMLSYAPVKTSENDRL
jgi:hypothetical protein